MICKGLSLIKNYRRSKKNKQLIVRYRKTSRVKRSIIEKSNYPKKLIVAYSCFIFKALLILVVFSICTIVLAINNTKIEYLLINRNIGETSNPVDLRLSKKNTALQSLSKVNIKKVLSENGQTKFIKKILLINYGLQTKYIAKSKIIERISIPAVNQKIPVTNNFKTENLANMAIKVKKEGKELYLINSWNGDSGLSKLIKLRDKKTRYFEPEIYIARGDKVFHYKLIEQKNLSLSATNKIIRHQRKNEIMLLRLNSKRKNTIFVAKLIDKKLYQQESYAVKNIF